MKLNLDNSIRVWKVKITLEGSAIDISGMFVRICKVFISIQTFLRLAPKKIDRKIFKETVPVTVFPAKEATDYNIIAEAM
jgi:hypothetical protein